MKTYTDVSLVAAFLKRELTDNERLTLTILIPAIQKWIDNKLGTTFLQATTATTRTFDGGDGSVDIDPVSDVTAVTEVDDYGTVNYTYATNDYIAEPVNQNVKTELVKQYGHWPRGLSRVAVTGKFSSWDSGVPEDIQMVATKIAADTLVFNNGNSNVSSESLEGHSITYNNNTAQNSVNSIASSDPLIKSILELRTEPMLG